MWWSSKHKQAGGEAMLSQGIEPDPSTGADDLDQRLKVAEKGYDEVLDATKHQDDKIGRFLTAIAFLTTGSLTLFFRPEIVLVRFGSDPQGPRLVGICAALFFALTILSVTFLLLTLGTRLKYASRPSAADERSGSSLLFFYPIAAWPRYRWREVWLDASGDDMRKKLLHQYVDETHNLAQRAAYKYERTTEAAVLFVLALLFLGVGVLLTLFALSRVTADGLAADGLQADAVELNHLARLSLAFIFCGHAGAHLWGSLADEKISTAPKFIDEGGRLPKHVVDEDARRAYVKRAHEELRARSYLAIISASVLIYIATLVLFPPNGTWRVGMATIGSLAAAAFVVAGVKRARLASQTNRNQRLSLLAVPLLGSSAVGLLWLLFALPFYASLLGASVIACLISMLPLLLRRERIAPAESAGLPKVSGADSASR